MSDEKKPFTWDKKKVLALLLLVLILGLVFAFRGSQVEATPTIQTDNPKFVLASWDYPDEYGQGIESIYVWHNVSGSWVAFPDSPFYSSDSTTFNATAGENLKLQVYSWLNRSYVGLPEPWNQGHKYIRHSVVVSNPSNSSVFSQQNFTYDAFGGTADPVEWYRHTVILNFLPLAGEIYTVTVTYDVFYPEVIDSEQVAYAGDSTWQNSKVKDSTTWDIGGTERYAIFFQISESEGQIEGFQYACYGEIFDVDVTLEVFNGTTNTTLFAFGFGGSQWFNGSSYGSIYNSSTIVLSYNSVGIGAGAFIDYLAIKIIYSMWVEVGEVSLFFAVPFDMTGYNMALVFAGLIMIPASTMYLAYGIKHDRSSERMFYGLIIFAVGFGLVVAGITP